MENMRKKSIKDDTCTEQSFYIEENTIKIHYSTVHDTNRLLYQFLVKASNSNM